MWLFVRYNRGRLLQEKDAMGAEAAESYARAAEAAKAAAVSERAETGMSSAESSNLSWTVMRAHALTNRASILLGHSRDAEAVASCDQALLLTKVLPLQATVLMWYRT